MSSLTQATPQAATTHSSLPAAFFGAVKEDDFPNWALVQEIRKCRAHYRRYRRSRLRAAVYPFLSQVFETVSLWTNDGFAKQRAVRAMKRVGCKIPIGIEPFACMIIAAAHPRSIDKRTVAKWARVLRYAEAYKAIGKPLQTFMQARGGINRVSLLYACRMGRRAKSYEKNRFFSKP